jgi:hypothetical protein
MQPSATHGKALNPETAETCRKPPPSAALRRPRASMVRRGSTVRVRQRALQKPRTPALSCSGRLALEAGAVGMEPFMGAFAFAMAVQYCVATRGLM